MTNNRRIKLIAGALRLDRRDLARACTLGGIDTSNSRADGWLRAAGATKSASDGSIRRRDRDMTDEELDAFCLGLKPLMDELDSADAT